MAAIDEMAIREAALRFVEDRTEFGTHTVTQPEVAIDGPMLRHGLQEMRGLRIQVPRAIAAKPDPSRLEERYET
ncbi:MAG TPA: hypothetical protein VE709_05970, partial [Pseudonocardiaceae bacterium]|nr:hypothetical protein [Pseudonocardiaceae bacterium]